MKFCAAPIGETGTDPFGQNNFGFGSAPLVADVTERCKRHFKRPPSRYVGGIRRAAFSHTA
jgi:hypothetical protein